MTDNPPLNQTQRIRVQRSENLTDQNGKVTIRYQRREDGWYVQTPDNEITSVDILTTKES